MLRRQFRTKRRRRLLLHRQKRVANLLKPTEVQFPSTLVANNFNDIIHQVDEKVNRKIDTVLKSRQFIRRFGDRQNSPETTTKEYLNGKDTNPQRLINNSRILYVNKKRASDWLSLNRLQLPLAYSSIGSDNIISRSDTDVKRKAAEDSGAKYSVSENSSIKSQIKENHDKLSETESVADVITPTEFKNAPSGSEFHFENEKTVSLPAGASPDKGAHATPKDTVSDDIISRSRYRCQAENLRGQRQQVFY